MESMKRSTLNSMNESSYEEYKKNLFRDQKKRDGFRSGKIQLVAGTCLLLYTLFILPFNADNACEIRGNEMTAGKTYNPQKVYYIENLQLLCAKTDADDDQIYCIAKFLDCDQNDWIISFTPGKNEQLAEQIRLSASFKNELNLTISGYFLLEYLEDIPFKADSLLNLRVLRINIKKNKMPLMRLNGGNVCSHPQNTNSIRK